jgi:RNA polymerase sigma factor for flagellar operon FliA
MLSIKNKQNRDHNILEYHHLVERIAKRLKSRLPNHVEIEDLKSVGLIGLIEALDRFDVSRGVPFRSYAEIRIQGAMLDYLRKQDWVPRSIRRRMKILAAAKEEVRRRGLEVNDSNIADHLNMDVSELQDLLFDSQVRRLISSHTPIESSGIQSCLLEDLIPSTDDTPYDLYEREERFRVLYLALQELKEREQKVLIMYYFQNRNLRKIGEQFSITESRACQLRKSALKSLYRLIRRRMVTQ